MNKNTKILLGVAAVAAVGYYFYHQSQSPMTTTKASLLGCPCVKVVGKSKDGSLDHCAGGQYCEPKQM